MGWLIQLDGDERRNEFLNAAWVKAVLPIRPGHERDALAWLAQVPVEGEAGLGQPYPVQAGDPPAYSGKTVGEVLDLLASELEAANTDMTNTLATEKGFEQASTRWLVAFAPPSHTKSLTNGSRCSRPTKWSPSQSNMTRRRAKNFRLAMSKRSAVCAARCGACRRGEAPVDGLADAVGLDRRVSRVWREEEPARRGETLSRR